MEADRASTQSANPPANSDITADVAVRRVLEGLQKNNARVIWEFLPQTHQNDLQQLVRDFATRIDAPTWQRLIAATRRTSAVLKKIPTTPADPADVDSADRSPIVIRQPAQLSRLLELVAASELGDLDRLRTIDLGNFLETTGSEFLRQLLAISPGNAAEADSLAILSQVTIRLVKSDGDVATIEVAWPGQPATEHPFLRREKRWLPKSLADQWATELASIRQQLQAFADSTTQQPNPWNQQLTAFEKLLDEVESASSPTDAQQKLSAGAGALLSAWIVPVEQSPSTSAPAEAVPTSTIRKPKAPDTEELLPDK